METIEVTARFDSQGGITPLKFTWQGQNYLISSVGRRWETADGQHILVMVPGEKVYELIFIPSLGRWYLSQPGAARKVA